MGLIDRWVKKFLGVEEGANGEARANDAEAGVDGDASSDSPRRDDNVRWLGQRPHSGIPEDPQSTAFDDDDDPDNDPFDRDIDLARRRLTVDRDGRRYAEGADFQGTLKMLDGVGRRRAADDLLADALLCTPSLALRRQLAERLLFRGERDRARSLLVTLADDDEHATYALTALGELAENKGDLEEALRFYERVLAIDITLQQPKARARRLRTDREQGIGGASSKDSRATLARFLGTRAAGARYAVVDEIGRGGAATVFRARDRRLDREVALKIFHPRGNREERRRRLIEEARIAGGFDHPHVVPVLDLDEERDLLVMVLCDGGSLQKAIQTEGRLGPRRAVELGSVLFRTLADVHAAGRLHLDIKPSNLLLHEGQLMVCDFGTAGMKELGAAVGTRAYMAPEQLRSAKNATVKADLYAAGLVVAEMIEGRLARRGEVRLQSLQAGPRRRALEHVLSWCTADNPDDRPGDGVVAAQLLLEAGALPVADVDGQALATRIDSLARQAGEEALARLEQHPLIPALRSPPPA